MTDAVNRFTGRVVSTGYIPYYVYRGKIDGKYQFYVIPTLYYINKVYDLRLPTSDSLALMKVHQAMTERLSEFIPIFANHLEIEDK